MAKDVLISKKKVLRTIQKFIDGIHMACAWDSDPESGYYPTAKTGLMRCLYKTVENMDGEGIRGKDVLVSRKKLMRTIRRFIATSNVIGGDYDEMIFLRNVYDEIQKIEGENIEVEKIKAEKKRWKQQRR